MNEAVTEYLQKIKEEWQAEICTQLRQLIHQTVPEIEERLQYGKPHFLKEGKYAAVVGTAKDWVSFTIFNAGALEAPEGFFEPGNPDRKTVKIRKGQKVNYALLAIHLQQATTS